MGFDDAADSCWSRPDEIRHREREKDRLTAVGADARREHSRSKAHVHAPRRREPGRFDPYGRTFLGGLAGGGVARPRPPFCLDSDVELAEHKEAKE